MGSFPKTVINRFAAGRCSFRGARSNHSFKSPQDELVSDLSDTAWYCSLTNLAGILVAAADSDRFDRALSLDLAMEGEYCLGLGERSIRTKEG
jgi:hypothetical protein